VLEVQDKISAMLDVSRWLQREEMIDLPLEVRIVGAIEDPDPVLMTGEMIEIKVDVVGVDEIEKKNETVVTAIKEIGIAKGTVTVVTGVTVIKEIGTKTETVVIVIAIVTEEREGSESATGIEMMIRNEAEIENELSQPMDLVKKSSIRQTI